MSEDMVRVYDFGTRRVTDMTARELAPGMVLTKVDGVEGEVWVEISQLPHGEFRLPPLTGEQQARVRRIRQSLSEVTAGTVEDWEGGLPRRASRTGPERLGGHCSSLRALHRR